MSLSYTHSIHNSAEKLVVDQVSDWRVDFYQCPEGLQCKIGCQWFPWAMGSHHWRKLVCRGTGGNQIPKKDVWVSSQYLIYNNNNDSANNNNNFYNYLISVIFFCWKGLVSCVLGPVCVWLEIIDLSCDSVVLFARCSLVSPDSPSHCWLLGLCVLHKIPQKHNLWLGKYAKSLL